MQQSLIDMTGYIKRSVKDLGLILEVDSRFEKMCQVFYDENNNPRSDINRSDPNFEVAREAIRDIQQLAFIFEQINSDSKREEYISQVQKVLNRKDSILPQNDKADSPARDAQVELYVYAVCRRGGFRNVKMEEPDVTCSLNGYVYSIAVKRIKNTEKLVRRVEKGISQISDKKGHGIIVVDTTFALNINNVIIEKLLTEKEMRDLWYTSNQSLITKYEDALQKQLEGSKTLGIMTLDHRIYSICLNSRMDWGLRSGAYGVERKNLSGDLKRRYEDFKRKFKDGLYNLIYN